MAVQASGELEFIVGFSSKKINKRLKFSLKHLIRYDSFINIPLSVEEVRYAMSKKVFIGNVPFTAQDEELQRWFAEHSIHPVGVAIVKHRVTGKSRGFGFADFDRPEDAAAAVDALNEVISRGRICELDARESACDVLDYLREHPEHGPWPVWTEEEHSHAWPDITGVPYIVIPDPPAALTDQSGGGDHE